MVKNADFSHSYLGKGPGLNLLPSDWFVTGKFAYSLDDYKTDDYFKNGKKPLLWKLMTPWDSTRRFQVANLSYHLVTSGNKNRSALTGQLNQSMKKDSLYEISLDIYYPSDSSFSYKYYPVFLCSKPSETTNRKNLHEIKLQKSDSSIIQGKKITTIKGYYKADGTEMYIHISTNLDYKSCVLIHDEKKAKKAAKFGAVVILDNICVRRIQ